MMVIFPWRVADDSASRRSILKIAIITAMKLRNE